MPEQPETLMQLSKMIADQLRQQNVQPQQPTVAFGLSPSPFGLGAPMGAISSFPQPTGVSVAVNMPLPDGREMSLRVHFGPEAAANLQQFAATCVQMFGPYLAAKSPRYYGGWNSNYSYARSGRR